MAASAILVLIVTMVTSNLAQSTANMTTPTSPTGAKNSTTSTTTTTTTTTTTARPTVMCHDCDGCIPNPQFIIWKDISFGCDMCSVEMYDMGGIIRPNRTCVHGACVASKNKKCCSSNLCNHQTWSPGVSTTRISTTRAPVQQSTTPSSVWPTQSPGNTTVMCHTCVGCIPNPLFSSVWMNMSHGCDMCSVEMYTIGGVTRPNRTCVHGACVASKNKKCCSSNLCNHQTWSPGVSTTRLFTTRPPVQQVTTTFGGWVTQRPGSKTVLCFDCVNCEPTPNVFNTVHMEPCTSCSVTTDVYNGMTTIRRSCERSACIPAYNKRCCRENLCNAVHGYQTGQGVSVLVSIVVLVFSTISSVISCRLAFY